MKAMIFGAAGQDGYYLIELLLSLNYDILAVIRSSSNHYSHNKLSQFNSTKIKIIDGDVTDYASVQNIISKYRPEEVYNLAGQSSVGVSFDQPIYTFDSISNGCLNILEAIRKFAPKTKYYQASSAEMFGKGYSVKKGARNNIIKYQDETSPMIPQNPYAIAKLAAHNIVRMYRDTYKIFACSGILHSHESPMRGVNFVTRKISKWVANFDAWSKQDFDSNGKERLVDDPSLIYYNKYDHVGFPKLHLGNIDSLRDWGHAKDYVYAMYLMMQHYIPDDYIVSTGEMYSVRDFMDEAFNVIGIINPMNYVVLDKTLYRPAETEYVKSDPSKIKFVLKWQPRYNFKSIVKEMVMSDMQTIQKNNKKVRSII